MRLTSPGLLLELDLTTPLADGAVDPLTRLAHRGQPTLRELTESLYRAARDDSVLGLIAQVGPTPLGLADTQEVREAILAFAASGKPAVGWAESFGESTPALPGYYLATAFEELWLQPSGELGLHGLTWAAPFLRSALDKLGVEPRIDQRYEYKNAADALTRTGFTEAHREAVTSVLEAVATQLIQGVADSRGLAASAVRGLMDRSPVGATHAREVGLVDHVGYRDQAYAAVRDRLAAQGEPEPRRLLLGRYRPSGVDRVATSATGVVRRDRRDVGLLHLSGSVRQGHVRPFPASPDIASTSVVSVLKRVAEEEHLGALVVRVDSTGGSYVASDAIWHAIGRVRDSGRPVVASMGNVAASGGYYIAMGADRVVATPATITGSIGVVHGKVLVNGLLDKIGVDVDDVGVGSRAFMSSLRHDYTEDEAHALSEWLDTIYWDFVTKVASSRGLAADDVHAVAKGRIWTGRQALDHGLVDHMGGTRVALNTARELAELPTSARVREIPLLSPWTALRGARTADDPGAETATWAAGWGSFATIATRLGLPAYGPLTLPWEARDIR